MQTSDLPIRSKSSVLYEDEHLFALNKPDGVLSHPNPKDNQGASILLAPYHDSTESYEIKKGLSVYLIHRIDKETSGCLLFAKDAQTAKKLKKDFAEHHITKIYVALAAGLQRQSTIWKDHLAKDGGKVRYDREKKTNAETLVEPLEIFETSRLSLLRLSPKSGKTHQLRVQAAKRNLHILGDRQYGNFPKNKVIRSEFGLKRMFLHASQLDFSRPQDQKKISIEAPLPLELHHVLEKLRSQNSS